MKRATGWAFGCTFGVVMLAGLPATAQTTVAGKPYVKQATREETREAFLRTMGNTGVVMGRWLVVGPFENANGGKGVANAYAPEELLEAMKKRAGDVLGPADQRKAYDGKGGKKVGWHEAKESQPIGGDTHSPYVDVDQVLGVPGEKNAVAYLYRRIDAPKDMTLPTQMGSDDGMRVWLNGEMVVDDAGEHPMSIGSSSPVLKLHAGPNHLLVKVSQAAGEWQFGMKAEPDLDPVIEAAIDWQLDADFPTPQSRFYRISTVPHGKDVSLEVGGVDFYGGMDGYPVVCTRRGDVFAVRGAMEAPALHVKFETLASGLQEPLGLTIKDREVFMAQRSELTAAGELPTSEPGAFTSFKTVSDAWKISGNYHEYAFGPKIGPDGRMYVNLNLAHTDLDGTVMGAPVFTRGWCVGIDPKTGAMERMADGLRSPDGLLMYDHQVFYTDNQGDYVATNKLSWVRPGSFHGHQSSLKFRDGYGNDWRKNGKPVPEITWPAVWLPYQKLGQSATDAVEIQTDAFGPFKGQILIGEQTYCWVNRVFLEKVKDDQGRDWYQGAAFPFLQGFASGVHRMCFAPDGSMFVGMTDRGWGSTGPKRDGLQRVIWTKQVPFEIKAMRIVPGGFDLEFTRPVDDSAKDVAKYAMTSFTYEYHPSYGSAEMDTKPVTVTGAEVSSDRLHVKLACTGVRGGGMGYVHELHVNGVKCAAGAGGPSEELLHPTAYYTALYVPAGK